MALTYRIDKNLKKFFIISVLFVVAGCATGEGAGISSLSTPVFFKPLSATLDQNALVTIQAVAAKALIRPNSSVIVVGTAENKGDYSMQGKLLSEQRANAVAAQLEADGIPKSRLQVYGAGAVDAPKGINASQGARRVLISIGH